MDLIPSLNPDDDVPDFEDGDDEQGKLVATRGLFKSKRRDAASKVRAAKAPPPPAREPELAMRYEETDEPVPKSARAVADVVPGQPQSAWSFKDTIARIDATSNRTFVNSSLQEKIAVVLRNQRRAATAAASSAGTARGKGAAGTGAPVAARKGGDAGKKRGRASSDLDVEIEEVEYEDGEGSEEEEEGSEEEEDEEEEDGSEDEGDSGSSAADDAGAVDDDAMDEEGAGSSDEEEGAGEAGEQPSPQAHGHEAAEEEEEEDDSRSVDLDALIASAKPNRFRQKVGGSGGEGSRELQKEYSKFFEPDPFSAAGVKKAAKKAAAATAGDDRLRQLQAGAKVGKAKGKGEEPVAASAAGGSSSAAAPGTGGAVAALPSTEPQQWTEMNLSRPLLRAVQALGYTAPTPVQRRTIPLALAGHDVCGSAVTGSGKTAAYLLPILERLLYRPSRVTAIRVLILVPTRELAAQVHSMAASLSQFCTSPPIRACLVVGGVSLSAQTTELRGRPDIVVATPGRMLDHIRNSMAVHTDDVDVLVLDEADRLLEMGFEAEVQEIVKACPVGRQTLLFSATMTTRVESLVKLSLRKPVRVTTDPLFDMANRLVQEFVRLRPGKDREEDREAVVLALVTRSFNGGGVLIFTTHKREAHRLAILLGLAGCKAEELHGNLTQRQRLSALENFRTGSADVLVATDLAGRGLDIAGVRVVINAQMPREMTAYVHRVGRTARAGRAGVALSLVSEDSRALMREIVKRAALNVRSRVVPVEVVSEWRKQVDEWEDAIADVLHAERTEREMRLADMEVNKAANLIDHEDEIHARPARSWFQSERSKEEVREASKAAVMGGGGAAAAQGEKEDAGGASRKRKRGGEDAESDDEGGRGRGGKVEKKIRGGKEVDGHRMSRKKRRRQEVLASVEAESKRIARMEATAARERKEAGLGSATAAERKGKHGKDRKGKKKSGGEKGDDDGKGEADDGMRRQEAELRRAKKRSDATSLATNQQHLLAKSAKAKMRELQNRTGMTGRRVAKLVLGGGMDGEQKKKKRKTGREEGDGGGRGGGGGGGGFATERAATGGGGGGAGGGGAKAQRQNHRPGMGSASKTRHKKRR